MSQVPGHGVRHVLRQPGLALVVESDRRLVEGQGYSLGSGEGRRPGEDILVLVDASRRSKEGRDDGWADIVGAHDVGGRGQELSVLGRHVAGEVEDPLRRHELGQSRRQRGVGVGPIEREHGRCRRYGENC